MKIKKWIVICSSWIILATSVFLPYQSMAANRPEMSSEGALLIDANTGQLLYKQKETQLYDVGELTKLLTTYLIYQLIEEGALALDDSVTISDEVYSLSQNYSIPNVPLRQDKEYTVESLLHAVGTGQANSALLALVEHIDGTEDKFVERMKDQLEEWGIKEYTLYNATGMDQDKRNKLSPIALGLCAYHLLNIAPEFIHYTSKERDLFDQGTADEFEMLNPMSYSRDDIYNEIDGLMSAENEKEDIISVQTAQKDQLRLVSIVLDPKDTASSNSDHKRLLTYGFAAYRLDPVLYKGETIKNIASISVQNGKKPFAELEYGQDVSIVTPLIDTAPVFNYQFVPEVTYFKNNQLVAPIKEGTTIGRLEVQVKDSYAEYLPSLTPPHTMVVLSQPIEKGNSIVRFFRSLVDQVDNWGASFRKFFIRIFN